MLFATIGQWKVFVAMMAAGLLVGLVYDLLAALRRLLRAGPLLSLCADLAFGLAAALVLGGALTFANYGQMRLFAFLGAGAGAALYALGPHRLGRGLLHGFVRKFRRIWRRIVKFRLFKVIFR